MENLVARAKVKNFIAVIMEMVGGIIFILAGVNYVLRSGWLALDAPSVRFLLSSKPFNLFNDYSTGTTLFIVLVGIAIYVASEFVKSSAATDLKLFAQYNNKTKG